MQPTALLVTHRTRPGQRDAVRAVWEQHMAPAITANPGHVAYHYCFDAADPDAIHAFQQYRSPEDAAAFLQSDAYQAYKREVTPLLAGPPVVTRLIPKWTKNDACPARSIPDTDHEPRHVDQQSAHVP